MQRLPLFVVLMITGVTAGLLGVLGGHALGAGGLIAPGGTAHVEVVDSDRLGVMAGLVTVEEESLLGFGTRGDRILPVTGWVVVMPEDRAAPDEVIWKVSDHLGFTDPNGGTWDAVELISREGPAWAVPIGEARYDPTLETQYNWALVVDWHQVPGEADLAVHYVEELDIR